MAITKDNFIVIYNLNDPDSKEFAEYYADRHNMDTGNPSNFVSSIDPSGIGWEKAGQLVGVNCSENEILENENIFNNEVLTPIREALSFNPSAGINDNTIWGIVLGYNVPGGFYNEGDIISSTSRLSRINYSFEKKIKNRLYNRSIFQRFNEDDTEFTLIVSRIDAPNLNIAKRIVDNGKIADTQSIANGIFYIDPYSDKIGKQAEIYTQKLLEFQSDVLPKLNLDSWSTTFMDPYIDVIIPHVKDDSFTWSWFSDRANSTFFQDYNSIRIFFYNADYDGAETIRDNNGKMWPFLSLDSNYSSSAGAMSNPTIEGFLNPTAFFKSLLNGGTLGESYIYSLPFLNWAVTLFGDPLTTITFPGTDRDNEDIIDEDESYYLMSKDLARIAAHLFKKEQLLLAVLVSIVNTQDKDFENSVLYTANNLFLDNNETARKLELKQLVSRFFDYPVKRFQYEGLSVKSPTIDDYLTEKNIQVSRLLAEVSHTSIIDDSSLLDEGWWEFEFIMQDLSNNFINYHFILNIYDKEDISHENLLLSIDSSNIINWFYEKEKDVFDIIPEEGVPTSFIGRKIRYQSRKDNSINLNEYLTRGETYYFQLIPYDAETGYIFSTSVSSDIIYT